MKFEIRGRPFDSEGGAWQFWSNQNIYFQNAAGQKIYFLPLCSENIYFLYTILYQRIRVLIIYLFSSLCRPDYLFSQFARPEYLFTKTARPPPQNQMVVPLFQSLYNHCMKLLCSSGRLDFLFIFSISNIGAINGVIQFFNQAVSAINSIVWVQKFLQLI